MTGHPNAGYNNIVSKLNLALNNPSGAKTLARINKEELNDIKAKAKGIWSVAVNDTYETTYGNAFRGQDLKEKMVVRPSSPTRKNNPHPAKVFMSSHMKEIPGYFDDNPDHLNKGKYKADPLETNSPQMIHSASTKLYRNSNDYLRNLSPSDATAMEATFQSAGINTASISISNETNNSSAIASNSPANFKRTKPKITLQSNLTNPYLYNDLREYREKYAINDHGMPNPDAKKPSRGDFMIHPDWHAGLKHHHLPCDC